MAQPLRGRNLALLLFLGAIWGTAFMFISLGVDVGRAFHDVPVLFAAYRFDLAGAVILLVALVRRARMLPTAPRQWAAIGVAAVLNVGAYHAFLFWGQRYTTEVVASVIVGLNPIITTVLSTAILSDERVGWHQIVGLVLGFGGIVVLAALKGGSLLDARGLGELMIALAVASWSLGSTLVRRTKHGMDVFAFTAWQMLLGALLLHLSSLAVEHGRQPTWDAPGVVSLVYLAIVSSSLGFLVYFTLLERVGPIRSNLVSHIAPVFAALAGFLVLHTGFEWRALLAFVLIASGFLLVARPTRA
ncbi:MAG TPA: DMT family transporter [Candidatus Thermoplasmatota archaeon]|nr:DMT family transporter [Candidatus Thermoplasmatota archaeon]